MAGPGRVPALDGVRGLAVLAVVGFHLEVGGGGHAAVTVFFVLSGYLITAGLLAEHARTGTVNLRRFYGRRARRLVPAAVLVTVVVLAGAALGVGRAADPGEAVHSVVAAWTQTANVTLAGGGSMAYELVPTWSLNVEEQFYVVWSLTAALLLPRVRRRSLLLLAATASAAALAWTAWLTTTGAAADRITYAPDTQLAGPLAGCALALALARPSAVAACARVRPLLLAAGVATLAAALLDPPLGVPLYSWGGPLVVVGTAALIAGLVTGVDDAPIPRLLALPPLAWLGVRSYAVYLLHVPVLQWCGGPGDTRRSMIVVVLTLTLAAASWRWLERPVLQRRPAVAGQAAAPPGLVPATATAVSGGAARLG